jgi:hypothetical protein
MSGTGALLARWFGIGDGMQTAIERVEWHWARPQVLWIGLPLLVVAAWWIARRHRERFPWLSPRLRRALDICRTAVLALFLFVLAGPAVRMEERIEEKPVVALLVDTSDSMRLPLGRLPVESIAGVAEVAGLDRPADGAGGETAAADRLASWSRADFVAAVERIQSADEGVLAQLARRFDLKRYEFARRARRADRSADGANDQRLATGEAASATGSDTALGAALQMAFDDASDRALAAVVILSDGRSTVGIDPLEAVRRATDAGGGQPPGPIYAVPIGSAEPPVDLAVADVLAAPVVALDDTVSVVATLESSGLTGRGVAVELRDGAGRVIETFPLVVKDGRQQAVFSWRATTPGTARLEVAVAVEPEEVVRENNAVGVAVEVSQRRTKVLLVDAMPRWDLRFIDHAIRRDTGFEATIILVAEGTPGALPTTVEGWAAHDLVVLGDVPVERLPAASQEALVEAVARRGVGVIFQPGGEHLPRDYASAPLAALFPVDVDVTAGGGSAAIEAPAFKPFRMRVTARGSMHPAFALSGDAARNRAAWGAMPSFFRVAAATRPRPSATVLAEVDGPDGRGPIVLVAEAPVGRGRTAWIGTEETFRWRRNVGDPLFWRFWGQALRGVARRDDRPSDANWLVVSPTRCEPDAPVAIEVNLVDPQGQPVTGGPQVVTVAADASQTTVELQPAGRPGLWQGGFVPAAAGRHQVRHEPTVGPPLTADCLVAEPTRERARPDVDRDTLAALADLTGGSVLEPADLATLPGRLTAAAVASKRVHEDDVWDTWPVLVLLVGLYCVDVAIRRLSGLS